MPTTLEANLCRIIAARDAEMRDDLAAHVAIPTGHNHAEGLDEYRGIVTSRLEKLGARTELVAGDPRPAWLEHAPAEDIEEPEEVIPPTAVCRHPVEGGKRVLIAGHLDTVFEPRGKFLRLETSSDGEKATGPGVVDMKGGILVAMVALEALAEAGAPVSWSFLLNSDEETGSFFSRRALEAEAARSDVGICTEPALPGGELAIARKGAGQFAIEVHGRSAHAGREFEKGVSAVYALARVLSEVETLSDLERGVTVNIGPIRGGAATNVVPDRAYAWGNVRYTDPADAEALEAKLGALATDDSAMPRVVVHRVFNRPAKPRTAAVEAIGAEARAVAESLGQSLPFAETGGVCDGNIMQAAGLPTIDTLGVRGGGLHTHHEWIELRSLVERAQLMACLLSRWAA